MNLFIGYKPNASRSSWSQGFQHAIVLPLDRSPVQPKLGLWREELVYQWQAQFRAQISELGPGPNIV